MRHFPAFVLAALGVLAHDAARAGGAVGNVPIQATADIDSVDRFIVRLRDPGADLRTQLAAIGGVFGERLDPIRAMSGGAHVVRLGRRVMRAEAREVARLLRADSRIASIEPDAVMLPMLVPNDTMYAQQWSYHEPQGGINLPAAWNITTGSSAITVAVIDSGVLPHADLAGRLLAGYDFIADPAVSNDGDGRDANAADPGDHGCNGAASSWHGTHVAGTIGAAGNNGNGVAGINWVSKILPVRVMGKCGGYTSDIVDGMRWAAGIAVPGLATNPNPARVENLSLGGAGACSATFQSAINDVTARGTVVVVAAGNGNADAAGTEPANCSGVVAVAATTRNGGRASYSNFGSKVTIAAPGGGGSDGVLSTLNAGSTTPGADSYAYYQGTSMAAPHVSGVVSLMLSIDPSLSPADVTLRLRRAARAFPLGTGVDCNVALCGAGIVDAAASLAAIVPPTVPPTAPPSAWTRIASEGQAFTASAGQTVRYGSGSNWITKVVDGPGSCTNAYFGGDPIVGVVKQCELSSAASVPVPTPAPTGWLTIATEGQAFSLSGTQTVRYGSGSSWITKSVTSEGACSNAFFGSDPIPGVVKRCEVASGAAPAWSKIATEGQTFGVSGTQTVRYGSGSAWTSRSVTGGGQCTNDYFGNDPIVGVVKQCEVASTGSTAMR